MPFSIEHRTSKDICQKFILTYTNMDFDCSRWTVAFLKDELRRLGLKLTGNKPELCRRLADYYRTNGVIPSSPGTSRLNPVTPRPVPRSPSPVRSPLSTASPIRTMVLPRPNLPSRPLQVPVVTPPRPVSPVRSLRPQVPLVTPPITAVTTPRPVSPVRSLRPQVPLVTPPITVPFTTVAPPVQAAPPYTEQQLRECPPDDDGNIIDGITSEVIPPNRVVAVPAPPIFNCFDVETVLDIINTSPRRAANPYNKQPLPDNIVRQAREYGVKKANDMQVLNQLIQNGNKQAALAKIREIGSLKGDFSVNPLSTAIRLHDREIVNALVAAEINLTGSIETALNVNYFYPIPLLIEKGANINNIPMSLFIRSFNTALDQGPTSIAEAQRIADLLVQNNYNIPPSEFLTASSQVQNLLAESLRKAGKTVPNANASLSDLIDDAIDRGDVTLLIGLYDRNADFINTLNTGRSPSTGLSFLRTAIQKQASNGQFMRAFLQYITTLTEDDVNAAPVGSVARQILRTRFDSLKNDQLLQAVQNNDVATVIRLLDQGVDPEVPASDGNIPVYTAILRDDRWNILDAIVQRRVSTLSNRVLNGILNRAASAGQWNIVETVINHLESVGLTFAPYRLNILFRDMLLRNAPEALLRRLVTLGAQPNEVIRDIGDPSIDVVERLVTLGGNPTTMLSNLTRPSPAVIDRLLALGGRMNDKLYVTAVNNGDTVLLNRLLDADIPIPPAVWGLIIRSGNPAIFQALLNHRYDLHADQEAILRVAIGAGVEATIEFILTHGGDLNLALEGAINDKGYRAIDYLLRNGADPLYNNQRLLRLALSKDDSTITGLFQKYYPEESRRILAPPIPSAASSTAQLLSVRLPSVQLPSGPRGSPSAASSVRLPSSASRAPSPRSVSTRLPSPRRT